MTMANPRETLIWKIIWRIIIPARLLLNAQFRIVYPFLPALSRGLGLPLGTTALLLGLRDVIGASSPAFGYLSDRFGRKTLMLAGLVALAAGAALVVSGNGFGAALIAFGLLGFSKAGYDPAMQAFVSDAVPYERRGKALGTIEYSWAGSWLIGVPIAGFLIARWSWQAPFLAIAILGVFSLVATWRSPVGSAALITGAGTPSGQVSPRRVRPDLSALLERSTLAVLAACGLLIFASENFLLIYGAWMEKQFALDATRLGLISMLLSAAELGGVALTVANVDRIGKRTALLLGLAANGLAYLLLPLLATGLVSAFAGVVLVALTSEFSIVSSLPLVSEMAPRARATIMAMYAALTSLAAAVATVVAPRAWESGGLRAVTGVSTIVVVVAFVLLLAFVKERQGVVVGASSSVT